MTDFYVNDGKHWIWLGVQGGASARGDLGVFVDYGQRIRSEIRIEYGF